MELHVAHGVAGAGKSRLLMEYLDKELSAGVPKNRIAFVTFTNQGADVGKQRAINQFGGSPEDYPYFRTLHSIAYRELGLSRLSVMTPMMYKYFGELMNLKLWGHISPDGTHTNDDMLVMFDQVRRNNPRAAARYAWEMKTDLIEWFNRNYRKFKIMEKVYDFTDFLEAVVKQKIVLPVDVAIIDEAQDLTTLQWKAVWMLFSGCKRVYVAGDADQAIYQWAGADVQYYLTLKPSVPMTILSHTWRCPAKVMRYASKILDLIKDKIPKVLTSRDDEGVCELINSLDELTINPDEDWLFLARNNCYLDDVEEVLRRKGYVYLRNDKVSVNSKDMAKIKQWEQARKGQREILEGSELHKAVKKGASVDDPWFDALDIDPDSCDYYRSVFENKSDLKKQPNIRLSSIHSVKGAEATNVVLIPDMTTKTWKTWLKDQDSELRCYYVAVTRASGRLFIVVPKTNRHYPLLF